MTTTLTDLYYSPRTGLSSTAFVKAAIRQGFSTKEVQEFLKRQEVGQLNREHNTARHYFPVWGYGPGSYQADLMFMDDPRNHSHQIPLLNIINVNSRYLYSYALKNKTNAEVLKALMKWTDEVKPPGPFTLQTDNGTEFTGKAVQAFLGQQHITHVTVVPEDHQGQSMVERANETLRRLFRLYEEAFKQPWTTGHDDLVWNYNHRVHSSIGISPDEATDTSGLAARHDQYLAAQQDFQKFSTGDQVRKLIHRKAFDKGKAQWSRQVYTITGTNGHHLFVLSDGSFVKHYEIQKVSHVETHVVHPEFQMKKEAAKKAKTSGRRLRKENIGSHLAAGAEEQIAAEKRQAKARETYVAAPSNLRDLKTLRQAEQAKVKKQGERIPAYVQKYVKDKWVRGTVLPDLRIKYLDGSTGTYSKDLIKAKTIYKFPLDAADKKVLKELVPKLDALV